MSVSNDSTSGSSDDGVPLSLPFLDFCVQVQSNDPSILPEPGEPFKIYNTLSEKGNIELSNALLENTNGTYLELWTENYSKSSAEAMVKYVRTSKRLQRIRWPNSMMMSDPALKQHAEMMCCFLPAFQESTSLKELHIDFPRVFKPSNLAFETILTHTQSLRSLTLCYPDGPTEDIAVTGVSSGLKKNTTLRELTLEFDQRETTTVSPILISLRDHPLLQGLRLLGG